MRLWSRNRLQVTWVDRLLRHSTIARGTSAVGSTGAARRRADGLWNKLADFVRFDARNTLGDHASACFLHFARHAAGNPLRHRDGFLTADRIRNAAGARFHDRLAGLNRNTATALFGNHLADLIRHLLNVRFTHGSASANGNLLDDFFCHHLANGVRNLGDNRLRNHATDRHGDRLTNHLWLVRRAGNLLLDNVRAPDVTRRAESLCWNHGERGTARTWTKSRTAQSGMVDLLSRPLATVLTNGATGCDRLHHGVAAFLLNDVGLLTHHALTNFAFASLSDRPLNATTNFTHRLVHDLTLSGIGLVAILRFSHRSHDRVLFFSFGGFNDLSRDLVLLFAVRRLVDETLIRFLNVFVGRFVDHPTDGVLLWFLYGVVNSSLTRLPFDATSRVTTRRLARRRWTTSIARRTAVAASGRNVR